MGSLKTCPEFVEHPHIVEEMIFSRLGEYKETRKGGCYICQCASASEDINPIADELEALGISNEIHQTGGFTMCIYIKTGETSYIYANAEGFGHYKDQDDNEGENLFFNEQEKNPYFKAWLIADYMKEKKLKVKK
jgi:hypothetical protein